MRVLSFSWITKFIPPAGNLTIKGQLIPVIASFFCISSVVIFSSYLITPISPILVASMGASVVILLLIPHIAKAL